jgi:hypothetical protein
MVNALSCLEKVNMYLLLTTLCLLGNISIAFPRWFIDQLWSFETLLSCIYLMKLNHASVCQLNA